MRHWLLAVTCMAMAGCLSHKAAPTRFFLIEPSAALHQHDMPSPAAMSPDEAPAGPAPAPPPAAPASLTLGLRPFLSAKPYGQPLAYLGEDHELVFRERIHWAEPPAEVVTRAVRDAVAASGRFQDVGDAADMARPDLILTGEVRRFLENRTVTPAMAEVAVHIEVREARGVRLLWAGLLRALEPVHEDTPGALSEALSEAVARIADDAARTLAGVPLPEIP